jgi:hypothetical protein
MAAGTRLAALLLVAGSSGAALPPPSGEPDALLADAARLEHGEGMPRDLALAASLYCQAARQGSAAAQYALGWMVVNGRGLPRDEGAAWRLFTLAAERGHPQAAHLVLTLPARPTAPLPACMAPVQAVPVDMASSPATVTPLLPMLPAPPGAPLPRYLPADRPNAHLKDRLNEQLSKQLRKQPNEQLSEQLSEQLIERLVLRLAPSYAVDPKLALAVIAVESGFRVHAVSPRNAQGLMQLIPATARRFRVADPFDPEANVRGGLAYLRWLLERFDGDVRLVAAAYNAGEGAVLRHGGVPPYPETRDYVRKVIECVTGEEKDARPLIHRNCRKTLQ